MWTIDVDQVDRLAILDVDDLNATDVRDQSGKPLRLPPVYVGYDLNRVRTGRRHVCGDGVGRGLRRQQESRDRGRRERGDLAYDRI